MLPNGWSLAQEALTDIARESLLASKRIYPAVRKTRLLQSEWLSKLGAANVYLKLENEQVTGSFKARGAAHKVLSLAPEAVNRGLVTCSTGNHALAFLHACTLLPMREGGSGEAGEAPPLVYLPTTASEAKAAKLRAKGASLVFFGEDSVETEREARRVADQRGMTYVSPYNDPAVAGGQGTIALELLAQLHPGQLDAVFVPVGGGGLVAGIASVLAAVNPKVRVVGCQPAASNVMMESVKAGRILDLPSSPTLSDGTAGGVEEGSITFGPCCRFVDVWETASEEEIADAMVRVKESDGQAIEGSAGVAVACYLKRREQYKGQHVVIICCGGNLSPETYARAEELTRPASLQ